MKLTEESTGADVIAFFMPPIGNDRGIVSGESATGFKGVVRSDGGHSWGFCTVAVGGCDRRGLWPSGTDRRGSRCGAEKESEGLLR
jgi:hypothetical protein